MKTYQFANPQQPYIRPIQSAEKKPVKTILLVLLASFAVGAIPVIYHSITGSTYSSTPTTQAGLWQVLGQKD